MHTIPQSGPPTTAVRPSGGEVRPGLRRVGRTQCGLFRIRRGSERAVGVTVEEWVLAATVFLSGLASGLWGC